MNKTPTILSILQDDVMTAILKECDKTMVESVNESIKEKNGE